MGLPGDLTTCVLTGTFADPAGNPMRGTVTICPNATLSDATGNVIIPQLQRAWQLFNGSFTSSPLVATDNSDITPANWGYLVQVALQGVPSYQFTVLLPTSGSPIDLSALSPATSIPQSSSYLQMSGGTLTGKLTLNGSPPLQIATGAGSGLVLTSDGSGNGTWQAGGATTTALTAETTRAETAEAALVPQSQTFSLANNTYQALQAWTVTGQTDTASAFGFVAGSQTYGSSPPIQGPAFWFGYNPAHLSQGGSATNAAVGLSCFADAGDTNNGAGGHGIEMNPAAFITPDGTKTTNAFQMVAVNDNTNTVTTAIRCGTGTVNGIASVIAFQNSNATKTYMQMGAATSDAVSILQNVTLAGAQVTQSIAGAVNWSIASTASTSTLTIAGQAGSALIFSSSAGTGLLTVSGNNANTVHAALSFQKSGVNKWQFEYAEPYLYLVNNANGATHMLLTPGASYAAARTNFYSVLQSYSSLVVGSAALATTATDGFLYLPSCAGTPTGTPTAQTGTAAHVYDTTNNKLYVYNGGWKSVTLS